MKTFKIIVALLLTIGVSNQLPQTLSSFIQLFYNGNLWHITQVIVAIGFIMLVIYLLKSSLSRDSFPEPTYREIIKLFILITVLAAFYSCTILGLLLYLASYLYEVTPIAIPTILKEDKYLNVVLILIFFPVMFLVERSIRGLGLGAKYEEVVKEFHSYPEIRRIMVLIPFVLYYLMLLYIFLKGNL